MVKILVILDGENILLSEGLLSILGNLEDAQVTTTSLEGNGSLLRKIRVYCPDVIVFFESVYLESQMDIIGGLCDESKGMRVLVIRKEKNSVLVLNKNEIMINSRADFFYSLQFEGC